MKTIVLPNNHLRALTSRLHIIEKHIDEMNALMNDSNDSFTYKFENDIPQASVVANQSIIKEVKHHISRLVEKYDIQQEVKSKQGIIKVKKTLIWETLCDTFSTKLKGYGEFPEENRIEFDSDIDELVQLTEKINF